MGPDQRLVDPARDERLQRWPLGGDAKRIKPTVMEIGNAWREAKSQEVAEREHMVGDAAAVGMVDGGVQIGAVVEQTVQDMERFAIGDRDRLAVVGRGESTG